MGEVAQSGEVLGSDGGSCFDFDGDDPAVGGFDDGVYFDVVFGAVVVEAGSLCGPGELAG